MDIKLPRRFGINDFGNETSGFIEQFLGQIQDKRESVNLDGRLNEWVEPIGLVLLASLWEQTASIPGSGWLHPAQTKQVDFFKRMNFPFKAWNDPESTAYLPILKVHETNVDATVEKLKAILGPKLINDPQTLRTFDFVASELLLNIFHHSGADSGFISAMTYPTQRKLQFAIVDHGIGVRTSLQKNPKLKPLVETDQKALELAVKPQVTSNPLEAPIRDEGNAGEGLFWASEFIRANRGYMYFHSGNGQLVIQDAHVTLKSDGYWPGTLVCLQFNLDSPINITDVFNRFAGEENGFYPQDEETYRLLGLIP